MESENGITRSFIHELQVWNIQGDKMEGERGVTPGIIDELHSWNIEGDQK